MRKTVVALALICVAAYALAQDSALKVGAIVAALWDDGDSSTLQRSEIKLISANPKVAKGQKVFAPWEEDGVFYLGTVCEVGTTDVAAASSGAKSFVLWHKGSRVGEIESNGRVWKDGSIIGEAPGLKFSWAAAIYYFFFIDE
jgi:hypothetical protein